MPSDLSVRRSCRVLKIMNVLLVLLLLVFPGSEPINLTITTHYGEIFSESNIWATNLPYVTVDVVSDNFTMVGSGFFSLVYQFANGSVIQECSLEVFDKNCDSKSCEGLTCTKDANMVLKYTINDMNDSKNESTITLPLNELLPVTGPSNWQYEKSTIIVKDCSYTSPGLDGVSLLNENVSCDFNCSDAVSCEPSYVTSTKAVCAANASWTWDGVCSKPITTTLSTGIVTAATVTTSTFSDLATSKTVPKMSESKKQKTITGGVLLGFSLAALLVYIVLIVILGFIDFIKGNTLMFTSGTVLLVINNVCGIVLIAIATDDTWNGGEIAAAVIGFLALVVIILFEGYLCLLWKNSEYAKGHAK